MENGTVAALARRMVKAAGLPIKEAHDTLAPQREALDGADFVTHSFV